MNRKEQKIEKNKQKVRFSFIGKIIKKITKQPKESRISEHLLNSYLHLTKP